MSSKALFICENSEELNDLSEIAKNLEKETTLVDITSIYGNSRVYLGDFDNLVVIKNNRDDFYGSWTFIRKAIVLIKIYLISFRIILLGNYSSLYSGIPIISARLIKFTFPRLVYYSYIRSVFQPRAGQDSVIWRALCSFGRTKYLKPFKADHYFVTGDASRNMLKRIGTLDENITISGSISLSKYITNRRKYSGNYKGILYLSGAHKWHGDYALETFQRKLVQELKFITEKEGLEFRIRPHPRDIDIEFYSEFAELDRKSSSDSLVYFSNDGNWLVVSNFSMMGFEFEYFGLTSVFIVPEFAINTFKEWFKATSSKPYTNISIIHDILCGKGIFESNTDMVYQRVDNPLRVISKCQK